MDLDQIQSFLAVAQRHSFTQAARERGLTQPGISRQVQKLERALGVTLVDRRSNALTLTPAGERFLRFAEDLVAAHARLLGDLRATPASLEGHLRIIASTTPGAFVVPGLVARFCEQFPRVQTEIAITDSAAVLGAVQDGRWEVGFTGGSVSDSSLHAADVAADEILLAVPAGHPFAQRGKVSLADLANVAFLDREEGSGTFQSVRSALAKEHLALPSRRVVMVLSSCQAIVTAVRRGLGVGFVSSLALADANAAEVVGIRLSEVSIRRRLLLVCRKRQSLLPASAAFVRFVEEQAHEYRGESSGYRSFGAGEASDAV